MGKINTKRWLSHQFSSGETTGFDFKNNFARDFQRHLKEEVALAAMAAKRPISLRSFQVGHYYVSGFIFDADKGRYLYFSIPDVRYNVNAWHSKILIRNAHDEHDFIGGNNQYTALEDMHAAIVRILSVDWR